MLCESVLAALAALNAETATTYVCAGDEQAMAIARDAETADAYLAAMRSARERYQARFATSVPASATVLGNAATAALEDSLREAGVETILPWIDPEEQRTLLREQVARQIAEQAPGLPAAQQAALVEQALAGRLPEPIPMATQTSAIAHEFGHMWFIHGYWQDNTTAHMHYGGAAPDWLDEIAGVALEDAAMTRDRRDELVSRQAEGSLPPLREFLTVEHPLAQLAAIVAEQRAVQSGAGGGTRAIQLSGDEVSDLFAEASFSPTDYYVYTRGFLDYLDTRCGTAPLDPLAREVAAGQRFETWLQSQQVCTALPRSIDALESDWLSWLET